MASLDQLNVRGEAGEKVLKDLNEFIRTYLPVGMTCLCARHDSISQFPIFSLDGEMYDLLSDEGCYSSSSDPAEPVVAAGYLGIWDLGIRGTENLVDRF